MKTLCDCEKRDKQLICDCQLGEPDDKFKKNLEDTPNAVINEIIRKEENDSGKWIVLAILVGILLTLILKHYAII